MNKILSKFYQTSAIFVLLISLNMGTMPAWGQQQTSQATEKVKYPYPQDFVNAYLEVCNQRSLEQGLNQQQAKSLCQCTISQYQNQYSLEAFKEIVQKSQTNQAVSDQLVDIGLNCAAKLSQ